MKNAEMIEDNAGTLYLWDGERGYVDIEQTGDGHGLAELLSFAADDTRDWNLDEITDAPAGKKIAGYDRHTGELTLYTHEMGTAGRLKFAVVMDA